MTAFGNFAHLNQGSSDNQSGMPVDIGVDGPANRSLVAQAWSFSPANFPKPSGSCELPAAGYGAGPKARLDGKSESDTRLRSFENSQLSAPMQPLESAATAPLPANNSKTLRSLWQPISFGGRDADTSARSTAIAETGPLPVATTGETQAKTAGLDINSHPLVANLNQDIRANTLTNFTARMTGIEAREDISRQIMATDSSTPRSWSNAGITRAKGIDPFKADNCRQSMEICPDGKVTTTTTLPDASATKIDTRYADKSSSTALTDGFGRITNEQRWDAAGQIISQTTHLFDHASAPLVPSQRTIATATQTIVMAMNDTGKVISSKIMPCSSLNAIESRA